MSASAAEQGGLSQPHLKWAVFAIALGLTMSVLDSAIANIALPTIAHDLRVSEAASIWVVNAYQLAVAMALLPLASLGEIVGYRRVHIAGLVLFVVASLCCALSATLALLTVARVVQGLGAAGMLSVNVALIRTVFPRNRLGSGVGMNAMVGSVATAVGPTVAAAILSVAHWPWLFAVNVPIGLVALAAAWRALPLNPATSTRFDVASAVLSAATFGLLLSGVDGLAHGQGWFGAAELLAAVLAGVVLVRRQRSQAAPLLPVDLLAIPLFALSVSGTFCCFAAQGLAYVALPFLLLDTLGRGEVATGLLLTPWPLAAAVSSGLAGRLADRFSAAVLGGIGLGVLAVGLVLLGALPLSAPDAYIIVCTLLCGLGFGFFNAPNNKAIIAAAPTHRSGGASGMLATARLLGQATGAALVALCFELLPRHGAPSALLLAAVFAGTAGVASVSRLAAPRAS